MEYEEDNLSVDKKKSLSQEVYSLQLVVEMRSEEVRHLKGKLARATQQLEQADVIKGKLGKATARMEDLEEQIKIKNKLEKQLSMEKSYLELNMTNTTNAMDKMSKNVESLQWRIRNNFDLPVDNLTPVTCEQQYQEQQRSNLPDFFTVQDRSCTESITPCPQSAPVSGKKSESSYRKTSLFLVSDDMIKATTNTKVINNNVDSQDVTSDFSPCSDGNSSSFMDDECKFDVKTNSLEFEPKSSAYESNNNEDHHVSDLDGDVDSLDEGVGDVSSDCEHPEENSNIFNNDDDNSEAPVAKSAKSDKKVSDMSLTLDIQRLNSPTTSPVKERIPSRFSFDM